MPQNLLKVGYEIEEKEKAHILEQQELQKIEKDINIQDEINNNTGN